MTTSYKPHSHAVVRVAGLGSVIESMGAESYGLYLQEFEDRIKRFLRKEDKLIKFSTDKYCLILRDVSEPQHVELAAAKLERLFEPPADIVDQQVFFSINCGFVVPPPQPIASSQLVQAAESALSTAIRRNEKTYIAESGKLEKPPFNPAMLPRFERALDAGRFTLFYQAKIDGTYGHVVGAEGLVRWLDSETKKVISPAMFIEQIEASNLIKPMTIHLLKLAISRCARWIDPTGVAVNVTPQLVNDPEIYTVIADALALNQLDPKRLTLEVTERGVMTENTKTQLEALRDLGIVVSIDDFGTGNCSLSYFRDLPCDQIKIDQSFVRAMTTQRKDFAIVKSCIDLAHGCGIKVVAEGVEDAATADALKNLRCDILQGYWFGKPLPVEEFELNHLDGLTRDDEPDYGSLLLH